MKYKRIGEGFYNSLKTANRESALMYKGQNTKQYKPAILNNALNTSLFSSPKKEVVKKRKKRKGKKITVYVK